MTDDREPFREARAAGKAKHHEQRLTRDPVKALRYLLAQYDRVVEVHAHVVMDTPEDRELHDRAIATFREAAEPIRKAMDTYPDLKVLTEAALRLGRKEALDDLKAWLYSHQRKRGVSVHHWSAYLTVAGEITRMLASPDATSGRTDPGDLNG